VNGTKMPGYLLDTNSVIYFFSGEEKISKLIESAKDEIFISFITQIELLCFDTDDRLAQKRIKEFIEDIKVILIDDKIISNTIEYRKNLKVKNPAAELRGIKIQNLIALVADT
jgi:predicted nucleic acid-binding protein